MSKYGNMNDACDDTSLCAIKYTKTSNNIINENINKQIITIVFLFAQRAVFISRKRRMIQLAERGGKECNPKERKKIRVCEKDKDVPHCPVKGFATWGPWMCWSDCQGTCGKSGHQTRKRRCLSVDDGKCPEGKTEDKRPCPKMCPNSKLHQITKLEISEYSRELTNQSCS